jgi:hypothetical protein
MNKVEGRATDDAQQLSNSKELLPLASSLLPSFILSLLSSQTG